MPAARKPLLRLSKMSKSFPRVLANDAIDLSLAAGEIHALLGENGAGKSTLVQLIYGILRADAGQIYWREQAVDITSPARARALGIAMVFQHFSLFDSLSVLENLSLGLATPRARPTHTLRHQLKDIAQRYGLPLEPDRYVYTLSVGERQRLEIIRCLLQQPKLLVMDEPTSVLTPQEVAKLFDTLRRLTREGVAILYISHKLDEIKQLCQHATILRHGKVVARVAVAAETPASLAAKMMGQALAQQPTRRPHHPKPPRTASRLRVSGLHVAATDEFSVPLQDLHLEVHSGEILGIAGVAGNGQDELLKALSGETPHPQADVITIDQQPCAHQPPNARRRLGLASIPEQRLGHAVVPSMNLADNSVLTAHHRPNWVRQGFINTPASQQFAHQVIQQYTVKPSTADAPAASLSGGNLQKFILGREIAQKPHLLIVAQPTWGVDAGATQTIRRALLELAANGSAVVCISQDLDELMQLSHRICAICAGTLSTAYPTNEVSTQQVGLLMAGAHKVSL